MLTALRNYIATKIIPPPPLPSTSHHHLTELAAEIATLADETATRIHILRELGSDIDTGDLRRLLNSSDRAAAAMMDRAEQVSSDAARS